MWGGGRFRPYYGLVHKQLISISTFLKTKHSPGKLWMGRKWKRKNPQHKTTVLYPLNIRELSHIFIYAAVKGKDGEQQFLCSVLFLFQQLWNTSAPAFLRFSSFCLSGFWCVHLLFLCSGDGCKDGGPRNLWPQMLPGGHVESTGFLYRHGRVSTSW